MKKFITKRILASNGLQIAVFQMFLFLVNGKLFNISSVQINNVHFLINALIAVFRVNINNSHSILYLWMNFTMLSSINVPNKQFFVSEINQPASNGNFLRRKKAISHNRNLTRDLHVFSCLHWLYMFSYQTDLINQWCRLFTSRDLCAPSFFVQMLPPGLLYVFLYRK